MASTFPRPALAPEWLAHRYDAAHDVVQFVRANRELRHRVPFLTDENLPESQSPVAVPLQEAMTVAPPRSRQHFILHSAYCCSTLLANALDQPGVATSFKEPVILNDLTGWAQRGASAAQVNSKLTDALTLLARPFGDGEASVLKPSNVCNGLAPAMLTARPDARAILLYAPLPAFLVSIASKGLWGRLWVRDLLVKQLSQGLLVGLGFQTNDLLLVTDLQAAAIGWLAQAKLFGDLARQWPDRVRTLNSEVLVAEPRRVLHQIAQLFELRLGGSKTNAIVRQEFGRNAKDGSNFAVGQRAQAQRSNATAYGDEVDKVVAWAEAVAVNANIGSALQNSII